MATTETPHVVSEEESWLEVMPQVACWRHLKQERSVASVVVVDGYAEMFPVNNVMDCDHVVFRTNRGTKLGAIDDNARVTFQIDGVDPEHHTGWSVLVRVGRGGCRTSSSSTASASSRWSRGRTGSAASTCASSPCR